MNPPSTAKADETELIKAHLIAINRWQQEYAPVVGELVEMRRMRADAVARAQENPTVLGSTGQIRENPAFTLAMRCQEQCNKLATMLLLTPAAAARAGVKWDGDPLDGLLGD